MLGCIGKRRKGSRAVAPFAFPFSLIGLCWVVTSRDAHSTRGHHKCAVWIEAAGPTPRRMDEITQLEILARAFLDGLVERHGREHAAHILERLAEGLMAGLPVGADNAVR